MAPRILVTGGAGFIGSSIVRALLARGERVTVLDDFSSGRESNLTALTGDVDLVRGDVSVESDVARALKDARAVFHEAAIPSVTRSIAEPLLADRVNIHGTLQVLEGARRAGVQRVIFAASAAAYGDEPSLPKTEDMVPQPLSPYATAKIAGEHYVRNYAALHGMHTLSLRYFNVFGSRQDPKSEYAAAIPRFVAALRAKTAPTVFGDGEQTRDFCHIDDVVQANLLALDRETLRGEVVNVARGESITINALIIALANILGVPDTRRHEAPRAGDIRHSLADIARARALLGYEPRVTIEDGLRETLAGFSDAA